MRSRALRFRRLFAVVLTVGLGASAPVSAQSPEAVKASTADEAEVQFRLGNRAFLGEKYERALGHYFASVRLAPNRNVMFNVARCYEKLRRYVEAYRYYLEYATGGSPKDKRTVAKALERIKRNVALLEITSDPPGATIYLGRKDLGSYGVTPRLLPVKPGDYTVLLERVGYKAAKLPKVSIQAGDTKPAAGKLVRLIGRLQITGEPAGASVVLASLDGGPIDGKAQTIRGTLPLDAPVPAGRYTLTVQHPRYGDEVRSITVADSGITTASVSLKRAAGTLVVEAEEAGALVLVDGQPRGFTPAVLDDLPTGKRKVEVRARGFKPFTTEVTLVVGQRTMLDAPLTADNAVSAASRRAESITDAPASVTAINADEMAAHGDQTLAETLRGVRGLFITDDLTYGFAGVRGFSRPGQYGQRLMVQLDGHALNDDWLGGSFIQHDLMVGLHALDRVEVVRGPLSALYGTGAFLGVVNMVTPSSVDRVQLTAGTAMAGFNTFKAYARVGVPLGEADGKSGLWVYGGGFGRQPGFYFSPARGATAQGVGGFEGGSMMTKATWKDLTFSAFFNQRRKTIPTASFGSIFGDTRTASLDRRAFVDVGYAPQLSPTVGLKARLTYDHYNYEGRFAYLDSDGGLATEVYNSDWIGAELAAVFRPASWAHIDVGAHYQYHFNGRLDGADTAEVYAAEDLRHHTMSLFMLARLQPLKRLGVFAGVRFDGFLHANLETPAGGNEDRFFWTLNPNVSVVAKPWTDGTVKLILGRGFRAPSAYELAYDDGGRTQLSSPGLTPEDIYSGEIEYRHELPADFWVLGSVFLSATDNLIELGGEGTSADPLQFTNQNETVWTLGAEFELGKTLRRGIQLNLHYAYQNTRAGALVSGRELINSPEHAVGAKAIVPLLGRSIRLATKLGVQTGRLDRSGGRTEPSVQWDVTLSGEVPAAGLRYAVGVRNLLDWQTRHPVASDVEDLTVLQNGVELMVDLSFSL